MFNFQLLLNKRFSLLVSLAILAGLFCSIGCSGPTIFKSTAFEEHRKQHEVVALLPFNVTIDPKKLPKDYSMEMAKEAEKDEAFNIQQQLYLRFLEKQNKGEYTIKFQDVDDTNAKLAKAGIDHENISSYTKTELQEILDVDALISGSIYRERPMSTGAAVAIGALFGVWGSTNKVNVHLSIHDGNTGELMWKYEHEASGSVGSSSEKLAESLMKNVSKKFPYKVPKS